ncbi:MAG TPA: alkaline phosphatase D family protein [Ramlibacter sp.]|nr:alkaline phosphatase D family protein [Ramlibacter sp.]
MGGMHRRRLLLGLAAAAAVAGCAPALRVQTGQPAAPAGPIQRIAFGSCMNQVLPQPIWDAVLADRPDLVIFGGDNVYASTVPWTLEKLEAAYRQQGGVPEFARLRAAVPHLATWDDHDYGLSDGGLEFRHRQASKEAFLRFWNAPADDPRHSREGIYDARTFGPPGRRVQVILLDTRWFRSPLKVTDERDKPGKERYLPDADPAKTMLGEAQWRWLEEQLRLPAELRLVVSGVQVLADGHGWERWGNFPRERERLYRLVAQTQANGVVFLSGDRHIGAFYRETGGTPYPFYELTSSGITHPWRTASEAGPNRIGALFTEHHYGGIDIDWGAGAVSLSLKDSAGAVRRSQRISFQELKAQP